MTLTCGGTIGWDRSAVSDRLFVRRECRQVIGLRSWLDASGEMRAACSREGHARDVQRRYGLLVHEQAPCCGAGGSTPHWVHCPERVPENEARWMWGDR